MNHILHFVFGCCLFWEYETDDNEEFTRECNYCGCYQEKRADGKWYDFRGMN